MNFRQSSRPKHPQIRAAGQEGGFALVVTVSILVLLATVAVGLLTLSTLTVRSASAGADQATARANARLALVLALGDLQKFAGSDTRVTAPANILDEDHPIVTGVWKSWEGSDHETGRRFRGRPVKPDYDSKRRSADEGGRFLSWLVSSGNDDLGPEELTSVVRDFSASGWTPLLGPGSLAADDPREVHVAPVDLETGSRGRFAWWVSGENQKARLPEPYEPEDDTAARWSILAKSHAVPDPSVFHLDSLLDDAEPARRVMSRSTAALISDSGAPVSADRYFHDMSTASVGLLTNTATGGWRKDLSLLTENWDNLPRTRLPFFRYTPDIASSSARPRSGDPQPQQSMLYPWVGYRDVPGRPPIYQHGGVSSWHNLMDYATSYKRVSAGSNGKSSIPFTARSIWNAGGAHEFLHKVRTIPVIARIHWVFSHQTSLRGSRPTGRRTHRLHLLMTPVVTMWNPHSVSINSDPLRLTLAKPLPCAFQYGNASGYRSLTAGGTYPALNGGGVIRYNLRNAFTLGPGETRVFSPSSPTAVAIASNNNLDLSPGYRPTGGHLFDVTDGNGVAVILDSAAPIIVDMKFDTAFQDGPRGVGNYVDMHSLKTNDWLLAYRMVYPVDVAQRYWQPIPSEELTSPIAAEVQNNPQPFLSTVFGSRVASDSHIPGKGLVQTSPLVNYTVMGKTKEYGNIAHDYPGAYHPVNSPFDYSFLRHAPGDSRLPNADDSTNRGYIISGFDKSDGLSRVVLSEIPRRPLASLGELQNWDMRYENPVPPYQFNIIGNSDASPLLPPDAVINPSETNIVANLQHDDAYCANHILFDDWFFSSIAPDPSSFGPRGTDMRTRFTQFISGERPLANRSYRPISEDRALGRRDAIALFNEELISADGWQRAASRLEVDGMFNVNSTSVDAWRALLRHARNQKIPHLTESRSGWPVELSEETDHAFSRFTVAADVEAGKPGTSGAFPDSSEFSGYRVFEEGNLDTLAEEIVEQVRLRGPFLSLSEFVNRQLSSGELALAGAVQTALNHLSESANSPYATLISLSDDAGVAPGTELDEADYRFPEAALGKGSYGLPGWTRQADILRPLAPVLSARDDTFTIRAYGEARNGAGKTTARAWCEATVRRTRNYIDSRDAADLPGAPQQPTNRKFGRRFALVSFRWLNSDEV